MTIGDTIGITIKTARLERGISQGDIERLTGLRRCYISRLENGRTVPSLNTLAIIAESLAMKVSQLIAMTEELQ